MRFIENRVTLFSVLGLTAIIAMIELSIMLIIPSFQLTRPFQAVLDALLLSAVLAPILCYYIKKRDRAEEGLWASEERARHIFNGAGNAMRVIDRDFNVVESNHAMIKLSDIPDYKVHGMKCYDHLEGKLCHTEDCMLKQILRGEERIETVMYKETPDGRKIPMHVVATPLFRKGVIVGAIESFTDLTDLKKKDDALKESEAKYRDLVSGMNEGLIAIDEKGYITFVNPKLCELMEYSHDELIGSHITDFFDEENRQILRSELENHAMGNNSQCELTWRTKTGKMIPTLMSSSPIFTNGVYQGSYGVITDLSRVREAETLYRTVLDAASRSKVGFALVQDIDGIEAKHVYVNDYYCELTGYTREELSQISAHELVHPSMRDVVVDRYQRKMRGEDLPRYNEIEFVKRNGETVTVGLSSAVATYNNKPAFIYYLTDNTLEKQMRDELKRAKEEAESANRAKSEFLANMSHEIRTPMNAVIGFSDLLLSIVTDRQQRDYLESIKTAAGNLLTLINDILDLSKIEAGRIEIQYEAVDPVQLLNEVKQVFELKISEKGLRFMIDVESDLPSLMLDETRLRQVIFNLVGNAVKFTEEGYIKITVETERRRREALDLRIMVEDTGIGIPKDQVDRIFESFTQQEGQSARKYGGTGLGLAISKRLVELMNGEISVTSRVGEGSTFTILLRDVKIIAKRRPPKEREDQTIDLTRVSFESASVLVVDDAEDNRTLVREWLSRAGLNVLEAEDGEEALRLARESCPDLILMDLKMPRMDGYEALKRLKSDPMTREIPVIALTASVGPMVESEIENAGFNGYIPKPFKIPDLMKKLSEHLSYAEKETPNRGEEIAHHGEELRFEEIEGLDELIDRLRTEIAPRIEELSGAMEMDEIEEFARDLDELARKYKAEGLSKYAEILHDCAESFDVTGVKNSFNKFTEIMGELRRIQEERG